MNRLTRRSRRGRGAPRPARAAALAGGLGVTLALGMCAAPGATALTAATGSAADVAAAFPSSPPIAADAPFTKTVNYLLSQLTLAERVTVIEHGTDPNAHGNAGTLNSVARLGIPYVRHVDALGINVYADATGFPNRLGLASSFDRAAYSQLGVESGKQGKALGMDLIYGPQVDMARYPSWSRNITTNGEDAYVSGQFAATEINGIQSTGEMSQVKHVSFYNGQAQATPSLVGSQAGHELYLPAAQAAIQQGGVSSLMCSYAKFQIVGEQDTPQYACQNPNLLNNIVKGQFGLKGFITSDYTASHATSDVVSGMDNEFASSNLSAANLLPLIDSTKSTYDPDYDAAVRNADARILYEYERFGLLDNSKIPAAYQSSVPQHGDVVASATAQLTPVDKASGDAVALKLAEESAVLLKNDSGALPLSTSSTVAVVGPAGTLMPTTPGGERSRGFGDRNTFTPLKAMRTRAGTSHVVSAPGIDWIGTTVPAASLKQDSTTAAAGLTRTTVTNDPSPVTTTSVDTTVAGNQTNLVKGYKYTWNGYIDVPADDTYKILLQRPYGTDTGNPADYNGGVRQAAAGTVSLAVDGTTKTLAAPSPVIIQNDFPDGTLASNGQYLGKDNTGTDVALTAGRHQISFTYNPSLTSAQTPTLRLAWAPANANLAAAVAAAGTASETVIFGNSDSAGSGPSSSTSASVATLATGQDAMISTVAAAAHAAGHKVVVVLNSGSAVQMPWLSSVDAVLEMWNPGEEGGTATSNVLYGAYNPSGKLPITFPVDDNEGPFYNHPERVIGTQTASETTPSFKWTEGLDIGYRWYTDPTANPTGQKPLFPFGFGLSYTTYDYSGLSAKSTSDGGLDVTFTVKNTGTKAGAAIPQIYLGASPDLAAPTLDANGFVVSGFQQSAEKIVEFDHVALDPGESKTETLHVDLQQLSAWDTAAQKWVIGTGDRQISLGRASDDMAMTVTKNIPATVVAPQVTTNPAATTTATAGDTVTLTAAATGTPAPTVQWQVSTDNGVTYNDIVGATSTTYSFVAALTQNGNLYRAVFTNDLGSVPSSATKLTVNAATTAPSVSTDLPASTSVTSGDVVTLSASATGNPTPTTQWQVSTNGGSTFTDIAGATGPTYSFTAAAAQDGNQYRAVFTNTAGSVPSSATTLHVAKKSSSSVLSLSTARTSYGQGATATLTVTGASGGTASLTVGSQTLTQPVAGDGTAVFALPKTLDRGIYTLTASYSGSAEVAASQAPAVQYAVTKASPTVSANVATTAKVGKPVRVGVTVAGVRGALKPTGTVQLVVGGVVKQTLQLTSAGTAVGSVTFTGTGKQTIRIVYSGDGDYVTGAISKVVTVTR